MAHVEQAEFCNYVKSKYLEKFKGCSVLDIGSLDINGNNRYLFEDYTYIGVDLGEGKNVDVISRGHEFKSSELFDVVISTECFEHDEFYPLTINNMYNHLKSGGLFIFTCATEGRAEHGTRRTSPKDAPFVGDYYKNLVESDVREIIDIDEKFEKAEFLSRRNPSDLYFWGIKK
jgi:SAM-dependent methyltransferase